jgi:hypothetical protein
MIKEFVEKVKTNRKKIVKQVLVIGAVIGGTLVAVKLLGSKDQNLIEESTEDCPELESESETSESDAE